MKHRILFIVLLAFIYAGCNNNQNETSHSHESDEAVIEAGHEDHDHEDIPAEAVENEHLHSETESGDIAHEGEEAKIRLTAYSGEFEFFAEADPFVVGKPTNILAHFSTLPDFRALAEGTVSLTLTVNGSETFQKIDQPTRTGIYSFDIVPETSGYGELSFVVTSSSGRSEVFIPGIEVFMDEDEALHSAGIEEAPSVNTIVFTKEQSWKIDFATEPVKKQDFGQVIKTAARIESAQDDEKILVAKTDGVVLFLTDNLLEGKEIFADQAIFTVSTDGFANNNSAVRFIEAQNNFNKAKLDYERMKLLAQDKIVSERELLNAKIQYDNALVTFNNLNENFNESGQKVVSPVDGFVKHLFVKNNEYVQAGQALISISQNEKLLLIADVEQKYAPILNSINSANIRVPGNEKTYTLSELNGKMVAYGRHTNDDNYLIPVSLQIDNDNRFIPGSFVEVFLKTMTNSQALTIPNSALLEEQGSFYVYVQITPELFEKRLVRPGATDGRSSEIVSGLASNDRIVTKGAVLLKLSKAAGTLDAHSGHVH